MMVARAFKAAKAEARSLDAMNKPTVLLGEGNWNKARRGYGSRYNRSGWSGQFR